MFGTWVASTHHLLDASSVCRPVASTDVSSQLSQMTIGQAFQRRPVAGLSSFLSFPPSYLIDINYLLDEMRWGKEIQRCLCPEGGAD